MLRAAANTPAVMTTVSLGTTGTIASASATTAINRYTHGEDISATTASSRFSITVHPLRRRNAGCGAFPAVVLVSPRLVSAGHRVVVRTQAPGLLPVQQLAAGDGGRRLRPPGDDGPAPPDDLDRHGGRPRAPARLPPGRTWRAIGAGGRGARPVTAGGGVTGRPPRRQGRCSAGRPGGRPGRDDRDGGAPGAAARRRTPRCRRLWNCALTGPPPRTPRSARGAAARSGRRTARVPRRGGRRR